MAADNNNDIEFNMINEEYDYHFILKDLNIDQYIFMIEDKYTVFRTDYIHDIVRTQERRTPDLGGTKYDIYIRLRGENIKEVYEKRFKLRYDQELASLNPNGFTRSTSPLMTFDQNLLANTIAYIIFSILLTIISVFLLMMLYHIRINHYKFTYGIYMSFGADMKKIVESSFWEMMLISVVTFLPASGLSYLINYIIYTADGQIFNFYPSNIIKILIFSLIIACASVLLPTRVFTRKTPMSLIISEDNSNLVKSPRRSFDMFKIKFPNSYELNSIWRFRKYNIQLFLTTAVFCVIFMSALFYANTYNTQLNYEKPQFYIYFNGSTPEGTYNDEVKEELYSLEGVTNIRKELKTPAMNIASHIKFDKKHEAAFANLVISDDDRCTNFVSYSPADAEIVQFLERYESEGDLSAVLEDENMIIISDSYENTRKFKLKPGDKVQIAKYTGRIRAADDVTGNELLKSQLKYFHFDYTEYTVCAVLKNIPTDNMAPIYLSPEQYTYITNKEVIYKTASIYIDQSYKIKDVSRLFEELRSWADYYNGVSVVNLHSLSLKNIDHAKNNYLSYISIAYLVLILSPVMWFFTQVLFYQKRENEFRVLQAFGAINDEIKKIHQRAGIINAVIGSIICLILNFGVIYEIYNLVNVILPKFAAASNAEILRYKFYMPIIPLLLGLLITIACGFLSAYLPYLTYKKKFTKLKSIASEFSEE